MSPVIIQNQSDPAKQLVADIRRDNESATYHDQASARDRADRDVKIRALRAKPYSWTYQAIATAVGLSYAQVYTICKR